MEMEVSPNRSLVANASRELGHAVQQIVARLLHDPERRAEHLGEAFIACEQLAREKPQDYEAARCEGSLESFLLPVVRASLGRDAGSHPSGGWLGLFVEVDGRPTRVEAEAWSGVDADALQTSRRALARAQSLAEAEGSRTLLRNLRWYRERLQHRTYDAIAESEARPRATIRTGVARARKFVLRVVHELENAQPAPLNGDAPPELEPLRQLWERQELKPLRRELERTRERYRQDPHWLNLAALVAQDRGERDEARRCYERALVFADAPPVRGRLLNNLGNLAEDEAHLDEARACWLRAHQLLPAAPAPVLNLLADAASTRSYASAQHYITTLGELLRSRRLTRQEETYVYRRLEENPKLAWLRSTDAWSAGPARWLARREARPQAPRVAVAIALALALLVGFSVVGGTSSPAPESEPNAAVRDAPIQLAGDSMGKDDPPPGPPPPPRLAG
jgi:tetratricopeptide (TPR) repeat protein